MKKFLKELWSQISIYFIIIFLQIIIFITIIILFNHLQAPKFLYSYIQFSTTYSITVVGLLISFTGVFYTISSKNRLTLTLITYSILLLLSIILYLYIVSRDLSSNFKLILLFILTFYIAEIFPIWICFFITCYKECKQYDEMDKSIMSLFRSKLVKIILTAVIAYLLIQVNIYSNISNVDYSKMPLAQKWQSLCFTKDFLSAIAYLCNSIATLYYPIIDIYMYTIKVTRKKEKDYEILD